VRALHRILTYTTKKDNLPSGSDLAMVGLSSKRCLIGPNASCWLLADLCGTSVVGILYKLVNDTRSIGIQCEDVFQSRRERFVLPECGSREFNALRPWIAEQQRVNQAQQRLATVWPNASASPASKLRSFSLAAIRVRSPCVHCSASILSPPGVMTRIETRKVLCQCSAHLSARF
jgi:hypothetical protein